MSSFNELVELIGLARDKNLLTDLLLGLTTHKERDELIQRIEIVKKLLQGEPQAKIAKDLGVGVATVTRGSKELAQGRFKILRRGV
jgi:TrpR family trp operon transcriptional repressor